MNRGEEQDLFPAKPESPAGPTRRQRRAAWWFVKMREAVSAAGAAKAPVGATQPVTLNNAPARGEQSLPPSDRVGSTDEQL